MYIDIDILDVNTWMPHHGEGMQSMQDTSGVHVWLVLWKAFRALAAQAEESLNLSRTGLGESDFRVLEALLHKGPLPVNTIGPKVWLTPGAISVAVDRFGEDGAGETEEYRPTGACAWSNSRRKGARSSSGSFGSTRLRWKRPPVSSQTRSGCCCCGF